MKEETNKKNEKTKKWLIFLGGAAGVFLIILLLSIELTSHSKFCATCHYMKPFFKSWETSSHSKVECSVCHYPPGGGIRSKLRKKIEGLVMVGRYWTKLYVKSKPWAEIRDESCLRQGCHDKRILEGKVMFKNVAFDHKVHFTDLKRGKKLQCTSCHSQIVQGEHITVTESSCFICHFKESEHYPGISDCAHCHHKEDLISEKTSRYNHSLVFSNGFDCTKCHSHVIMGDGEVPRENCYKCHWETERLEKYEDTDLMHTTHIYSNKIECNQCHMEIQHKIIKDITTIADCQTCHTDYHKSQKILFMGEGGKGVPHPLPNIMLEKGLSCKGCHIFHEESGGRVIKSETFISKAQACESCHGKGFARIMRDWEISTEKKVGEMRRIYFRAQQEVQRSKSSTKNKAKMLLDDAAFNIDIVDRGKGVHNVEYSQALLKASFDKVVEALGLIQSSYQPHGSFEMSEIVPTQCSNCHAGIEEITTQVFGMDFPHHKHLIEQRIECSQCHSNVRKHGEFIATKQSCAVCHHKDTQKDCTSCHRLQASFYQGGKLNGTTIPQDIMAEAEVECLDCHLNSQEKVVRAGRGQCLDCHESEFGDMLAEWQVSVKKSIATLIQSLRALKRTGLSPSERNEVAKIETLLHSVELDGSSGVHNYPFIDQNLTSLIKRVESLKNKIR